jgi:lipopolysaccharide/colanic/teichoic acid biosynthesis glycosyltransferase
VIVARRYLAARYPIDRVIAAVILVLLTPVLVAVTVAILLTSGRPVLFRQDRVGRHGEIFSIVKFRTMVEGAEEIGGGYLSKEVDLMTPIGKFLRASSLDELPQLVNIVKGDMAFIGPRPSLVDQAERYTPLQRRRLEALPGITGLAQVTYRNDAPWSKRIILDIEYIDKANPLLDLVLLMRTLKMVATGSGVLSDQTPRQVDDLG